MAGIRGLAAGMRGVVFTLAMLAVVLKAMTPAGFMVTERSGAVALVICTGHGPVVQTGKIDPGDHQGPKTQTCAYAAQAATPILYPPPILVAVRFAQQPQAQPSLDDLAPGRGLAAPPPPSLGPPTIL